MTLDSASLVGQISPPLDQQLAEALISEFIDVERRYVLGDWEPTMLDGGQFAEVASRIVYHIDTGKLHLTKGVGDCLKYVEDVDNKNSHAFPAGRKSANQLCKALRTLYKLRSQRGAIHIDPDYTANELDATFVLAIVRWLMADLLRLFWKGSTSDVARAIREIVRYDVPAVLVIDGRALVLHTDCTVEEEILLLLHNAGEAGMNRTAIGEAVLRSASSVTNNLKKLISPALRQAVKKSDGTYVLTPTGARRVRQELGEKLLLS